ncbi:MAG: hypothetical protein PHG70_10145 [Synergistaceae bacterium]|jgi:hypothetical protein|nr:hypothetical protein [Synergistaceae bacterium]
MQTDENKKLFSLILTCDDQEEIKKIAEAIDEPWRRGTKSNAIRFAINYTARAIKEGRLDPRMFG